MDSKIEVTLIKKVADVVRDKEFIGAVLSHADTDEKRKELIEYIDSHDAITKSQLNIAMFELWRGRSINERTS